MSSSLRTIVALVLAFVLAGAFAEARPNRRPANLPRPFVSNHVAFMHHLRDARVLTVYADGRATIAPPPTPAPVGLRARAMAALKERQSPPHTERLQLPLQRYGSLTGEVPLATRLQIVADLEHPRDRYAPGQVVVVFKPGVSMAQDRVALTPAATTALRTAVLTKRNDFSPHPYTNDARMNRTLMQLGVDRTDRILGGVDRGTLSAMRARAEARLGRSLLAFENAYVLHLGASSVPNALRTLRASSSVAYVSPDYTVSSMMTDRHAVPADALKEISGFRRQAQTFGRATRSVTPSAIPRNSAVAFSLQGMLNAQGVDAVAAFDEIGQRFGQLPGTGEIITNVGLGDVTDSSEATNTSDPCNYYVANYGPTTHLIGGQHYLDWPSMPLIPVWVADTTGTLSTSTVCGEDPLLGEVGLDFSVMAPLPDELQRAGKTASLGTDLLGIAPGATYRWVAPGTTRGVVTTSNILGAFIGAARQQPGPSVITASLGFGADAYGFPGRYFEDDPLVQSIVAGIVSSGIVVCISANDGTRLFTTAALGPSGGSAATNVGTTSTTTVDDLYYSTAPSVVPDSGAIDVGGTTLDDIASANPIDPASGALANVTAFPETRYNGMLAYSSGFGSRVNISAPGDNVAALQLLGLGYDSVGLGIAGGTSASAPEVAAAAAIARQVARLTGHPFATATQVRDALVAAALPVANPPQADVQLTVGPRLSVRRVVEQLLAAGGKPVPPGVARVAVQGRRSGSFIATKWTGEVNDSIFVTALDPSYIRLDGPFSAPSALVHQGTNTGAELNSYITLAPDWEAIPANATYRLTVGGQPGRVIATTPYVRLLPAQLFAAAGLPLAPGLSRTLSLTYSASVGLHTIASSTFQLTFGPPAPSSRLVLAPRVPPVVSGSTIPVTYDLRGYPAGLLNSPTLNVSMPGVTNQYFAGVGLYPYYSVPLTATQGTVNVPVSSLAGGGTYAIWIALQPGLFLGDFSDFAFTRVDTGTARPPAPLLAVAPNGSPSHGLNVPYKGKFTVSYDVSHVPQATGAIIEISAPPPGFHYYNGYFWSGLNTFRNPNGSQLDDNGVVTGSIYHVQASGTAGNVTIDPLVAKIPSTTTVNVRVIATAAGTPVGEAGDTATLFYAGIDSLLGRPMSTTYLNPNGTDGYLTEDFSLDPAGNITLYTVEAFDLQSGALTGVPLTATTSNILRLPFVQNDTLVATSSIDGLTWTDFRATPPAGGFSAFTFPAGSFPSTVVPFSTGTNSLPTRSAYLGYDLATGSILATRGDVTTGTAFGAPVDITPFWGPNADFSALFSLAYDADADRGYLMIEDASVDCTSQSPQLITIDFGLGTASARTLPIGAGIPSALDWGYYMAVDPTTHVAAVATNCQTLDIAPNGDYLMRSELTLLDLATGTTSRVFLHTPPGGQNAHGIFGTRGGDSTTIGIDPVNHLILQRSMYCPDFVGTVDVNARVCLNLYDEKGALQRTISGLFADAFVGASALFNGVNGSMRTGVASGQQAASPYVYSVDVQPYTY